MSSKIASTTLSTPTTTSSPNITRSTITTCTFQSLSSSDRIHRSDLSTVDLTNPPPPLDPKDKDKAKKSKKPPAVTVSRTKASNSTLTRSSARRCTLADSELVDVPAARSVVADSSTLRDVPSIRRTSAEKSLVEKSSLARCGVKDSTVSESVVCRSTLDKVRLLRCKVKRTTLVECDVEDCEIFRTEFKGMRLRNGVWKKGRLIGKVAEGEVIAIGVHGEKLDIPSDIPLATDPKVQAMIKEEPGSTTEEDPSDEDSVDLAPPPYSSSMAPDGFIMGDRKVQH
ncbi:hypothetical protein P168DRAFT_287695 [Aspergillus campestris IBT 28561]|uniref:Uncharacterized protein n=1 Tax=Aspergillus campestris (strain IBT 28561) TaxID=1392248 RepID=A0A2I1DBH1_ASPC2|nr:uncharacterized protein P168DRAFT_287695 [Aspergillus campestris IBT 28561]PKY07207.1 hypothetical protein P168DRAFT_287695 [Aspergillus campestris IBT 28561]